ncbi:hypothetical protein K435DRAFT_833229 [Dendrothele bispora CBS 962.96]|uniref:DUF6533 domain-containing protein n=1 Tax=Dendrothele bispora (strain CBS 962.96) TaxID=1314807 RepID=A0A4S8MZD3_DENBC|nr:hypothetical protein K435DRAFT_833229 [Dendrothele bispora CBS 962.96]
MSGMTEVNWAAAESVSGGDATVTKLIATGLGLIHVLQVYTSSMMAIAVWDWLVCLRMEWQRIWKREWSLVKILYLWTRYYGLFAFALNLWLFNGNFTISQCRVLHYLIAATCMWVTLGSEAILAVRTYAFLGRSMVIGAVLGFMLVGETVFLLYVSIAGVSQIAPALGTKGPCTASDKPGQHIVTGFWLAPVAFDLICTFLTVYKALAMERNQGVKSHIVKVFLREGLLYFLAAFMFQKNQNIQNINAFLALVLSQVLCCRMVLSLRNRSEPSSISTGSVGHSFATPGTTNRHGNATGTRSGFSIPLSRFENDYGAETFGGVQVKVDVEHDLELRDEPSKKSRITQSSA